MGVLFERCQNCGSTKTNSGLLSGICPNCGQERELVIGPGGNNYGEDTRTSEAKQRRMIEACRETVIKVNGNDEGVPTVDEVLEKMNRKRLST